MRNLTLILLCMLMGFATYSCKSDDDGGDGPAGAGTFTAKVNGENFTGLEGTVIAQTSNGALVVNGGTEDSETIQIIIPVYDGVGTYPLNFMNLGTYAYLPDSSNPDPSTVVTYSTATNNGSGEINISAMDGSSVSGTFHFTAGNLTNTSQTVNVTDGEFNIQLTQ